MKNVQKNLMGFGLDNSDTKIYLTLAKNGELDVPTLVDNTGLSRTAIYDSLNILLDKKLIKHRKIGRIAYYKITHPDNLKILIQEKKQIDAELERNMKANIKTLGSMFQMTSPQKIFEGKEGIIQVYETILEDRLPIDSIEDKGDMMQFIPDYVDKYVKKRIKYKLFNRSIVPTTNLINDPNKRKYIDSHHVDAKLFPFDMDIKINKKRVNIVTLQENSAVGVILTHPEIVKNFQILFNWLWEITKPQKA